ncbi:MAG: exodeoxyribonuclease VII small subunit [Phototrophicaceae bacterium]|jgi:exodeoxyribonuclease VII small subunit
MDELTFEQAYTELNEILARLESGTLPLAESVALYERGQQLSTYCDRLLDAAELRVQRLNAEGTFDNLG